MVLRRRKKPPDLPLPLALLPPQSHPALTLDLLGTPRYPLVLTRGQLVRFGFSLVSSHISCWPSVFGGYCSLAWLLIPDLSLRRVGTKARAWNVVSFRPD
uniref:Uncharacterized protein n=1 Tax=Opuntia streptacantha TaxID=393608 RepID=A0A7C9CN38_OPUST